MEAHASSAGPPPQGLLTGLVQQQLDRSLTVTVASQPPHKVNAALVSEVIPADSVCASALAIRSLIKHVWCGVFLSSFLAICLLNFY